MYGVLMIVDYIEQQRKEKNKSDKNVRLKRVSTAVGEAEVGLASQLERGAKQRIKHKQ